MKRRSFIAIALQSKGFLLITKPMHNQLSVDVNIELSALRLS